MKVLVPTNSDCISDGICPSFGRAPYFLVFDLESNTNMFVKNPGGDATSGAGVVAAQKVVDLDVGAVLAPRMGKNSADIIKAKSMKLYKSISDDVIENINLLKIGEAKVLVDIHPGFHQHG